MELAMEAMKSWQMKELITYVLDITNILAEEVNKTITGFQINSLLTLTDMKSQKNKSQTMMKFLADQLEQKNPKLLELAKEVTEKCDDALSSFMVTQLLFPDATSKYFEIANMIREIDPEKNKALIGDMKPFVSELQKVILDLNQKILEVDRDISYFGGIFYDELTWGANVNISDLSTVWKKLLGPGIVLNEEANGRILRDSMRYVFFTDMKTFMKSLVDANIANAEAKKKAEAEKRMAEKKAANEKARADKKVQSQSKEKMEGIDVLDSVKASLAEEKIVEETRNIGVGQMIWKRMALRQKIASALQDEFTIIPGSSKSIPAEYLAELKEAFDVFDKERLGRITSDMLGEILKSLGQNPTKDQLLVMTKKLDQDGNGNIDFEEFCDFMATTEKASLSSLEFAFKAIDVDGNGILDLKELGNVLEKLGEKPTKKQLEYMMQAANGEVGFDRFVRLMNGEFS